MTLTGNNEASLSEMQYAVMVSATMTASGMLTRSFLLWFAILGQNYFVHMTLSQILFILFRFQISRIHTLHWSVAVSSVAETDAELRPLNQTYFINTSETRKTKYVVSLARYFCSSFFIFSSALLPLSLYIYFFVILR
jgi:hypothetical protein